MTATSITSAHKPHLLINRNYAFLWGGQTVSNIGDVVFNTTLVLWIATVIAHNQPWAPLASSGVLLITAIPTIVIGPLAGVFVDRWNKRHTMLYMDAIRAILILLLVLATGVVPLPFFPGGHITISWQIGIIYTITFLTTTCAQFFNPARFALIGDVVEPEYRAKASGLGQLTSNTAIIIGPFLAAPLLFIVGIQWALIFNAISFGVSFLAICFVRLASQLESQDAPTTAEKPASSFWKEFKEGLHFFRKNRTLVTILIAAGIVTLGTGALETLDIYFVIQNLHVQASFYGFLGTAFGVGAIAGAVISTFFLKQFGVIRAFWLGLIVTGILIIIFARQTLFIPALIIFFMIGIPVVTVNTVIGPLMLQVTPRHLLGRVISVFTPAMSLISILSISLAGFLATALQPAYHWNVLGISFGSIDTIFTATGILVIVAGVYALLNAHSFQTEQPAATAVS